MTIGEVGKISHCRHTGPLASHSQLPNTHKLQRMLTTDVRCGGGPPSTDYSLALPPNGKMPQMRHSITSSLHSTHGCAGDAAPPQISFDAAANPWLPPGLLPGAPPPQRNPLDFWLTHWTVCGSTYRSIPVRSRTAYLHCTPAYWPCMMPMLPGIATTGISCTAWPPHA